MRKEYFIVALGLFAAAGTAAADELAVPQASPPDAPPPMDAPAPPATDAPAPVTLPAKGVTMTAVKKQFGEPRDKKPTVGGDTPKHPPITRWDYDGFVVFFERDRVVDAVVPGAPPKLRSTRGLTPATNAPPPPEMPTSEAPPAEPVIPETPPDQPPPPTEPAAEAAPVIPEAPQEAAPAA